MNELIPIQQNEICPKCKSSQTESITYSDTVEFRGMDLDVEDLQESNCQACNYKWINPSQRSHNNSAIKTAYASARDELREKQGLMTGNEIAKIRESLALNQREAATFFGGGYNAFNKYESGEVLQSFAMDRLLRLTSAVGHPALNFLKDVFAAPDFFVISASKEDYSRIEIKMGSGIFINSKSISGTSQFEKYQPSLHNIEKLNLPLLPIAHELYSVLSVREGY
jgi:putative zinc finger/helix-turn-helix YgiT family protein